MENSQCESALGQCESALGQCESALEEESRLVIWANRTRAACSQSAWGVEPGFCA